MVTIKLDPSHEAPQSEPTELPESTEPRVELVLDEQRRAPRQATGPPSSGRHRTPKRPPKRPPSPPPRPRPPTGTGSDSAPTGERRAPRSNGANCKATKPTFWRAWATASPRSSRDDQGPCTSSTPGRCPTRGIQAAVPQFDGPRRRLLGAGRRRTSDAAARRPRRKRRRPPRCPRPSRCRA